MRTVAGALLTRYALLTHPVVPSARRTWVASPLLASVSTAAPECNVARRGPRVLWLAYTPSTSSSVT